MRMKHFFYIITKYVFNIANQLTFNAGRNFGYYNDFTNLFFNGLANHSEEKKREFIFVPTTSPCLK